MRLLGYSTALVVATFALALGVSGCARTAQPAVVSGTRQSAAETTTLAGAIGAATGVAEAEVEPADAFGDAVAVEPAPIDSAEAADLEAELTAIERELESLDMPSDSDFADIEGSL